MDFEEAVEKAPPGWRHFSAEDIARLPSAVREHELARIPPGESEERLLRALFWTLVYHLEPERWDELARHEPISTGLLDALPDRVHTALDVGAGSGRLTEHLVKRSARTIAVEPSAGLRGLLVRRLPRVRALAGWAERLPLRDGSAQLTAACGAFGPDPEILAELQRVTTPGGTIALVSPEQPDWFEAMGWRRIGVPPETPPHHPVWLDDFFGPLDPPHEMVLRVVEAG
jgi:SAM-dependent methyltransferase